MLHQHNVGWEPCQAASSAVRTQRPAPEWFRVGEPRGTGVLQASALRTPACRACGPAMTATRSPVLFYARSITSSSAAAAMVNIDDARCFASSLSNGFRTRTSVGAGVAQSKTAYSQ